MSGTSVSCNACTNAKELREHCEMDASTKDLLKTAITQFGLSGRGYDRILKVSRTIAGLEGADNIEMRSIIRGTSRIIAALVFFHHPHGAIKSFQEKGFPATITADNEIDSSQIRPKNLRQRPNVGKFDFRKHC